MAAAGWAGGRTAPPDEQITGPLWPLHNKAR